MFPVHRLEDDLSFGVAIEDEGCGIAVVAHRVQDPPRDVAIEQAPRERRAIHATLDSAIADDEPAGGGQRVGHWPRARIAAAGHERNVNAGSNRSVNRIAILVREPAFAVEQRAVHVDANQSNHAVSWPAIWAGRIERL